MTPAERKAASLREFAAAFGRSTLDARERTAAETAAMQPNEANRQRGRVRRRLEDALERRALAHELDTLE